MLCKINLQIANYDSEKGKVVEDIFTIGDVSQDQEMDLDAVAELIAQLDEQQRLELAASLRAANQQSLTEQMVKKHEFISNTSLKDLTKIYPDLKTYNIPPDLQHNFTLIKCYRANFNGQSYKGRVVGHEGKEIFIINNAADAEKLFKHLSIRLNLDKFIEGNTVSEELIAKWDQTNKPYMEALQIIASKHRKTIRQVLDDFLVNKQDYKTITSDGKVYDSRVILDEVLFDINGSIYDITSGNKSALHMDLDTIKKRNSSKHQWVFDKHQFYKILVNHFPEFKNSFTYDQFNQLDTESLNQELKKLFIVDANLFKLSVASTDKGHLITKEPTVEKKLVKVTKEQIKQYYKESIKDKEKVPKSLEKAIELYKDRFIEKLTEFNNGNPWTISDAAGNNHEVVLNMDENLKLTAGYYIEQKAKVVEKGSTITLNTNIFSSVGEIYNFSYDSQPICKFVDYYKGFYIYAMFKDGFTHYAISRSVISPKAHMRLFESEEAARADIDNNKETIKECGLWSVKQIPEGSVPRTSHLEMSKLKEGSIVTVLDMTLPRFDFKLFSNTIKDLFDSTLDEFHDKLKFIKDIQKLDSPEKAAAFMYLIYDRMKSNEDFMKVIKTKPKEVQSIIDDISSRSNIHYFIEKKIAGIYEDGKRKTEPTYYLRKMEYENASIDLYGQFQGMTTQDFIERNLREAVTYFKDKFNLNIYTLSNSTLEEFSKKHNLNLENRVRTVKAFVYNGEIYINTSNAQIDDLFHELSHIFLGAVKAEDKTQYDKIIAKYMKKPSFTSKFEYRKRSYEHYAIEDVIEEAVADLIAQDMFSLKTLGDSSFSGDDVLKQFEKIFTEAEVFMQSSEDNGLGFYNYMRDLLDENADSVQKNMRITEFIRQGIENETILRDCE